MTQKYLSLFAFLCTIFSFHQSHGEVKNLKENITVSKASSDDLQTVSVFKDRATETEQFVAILPKGTVVNHGGILTKSGYILEDIQTTLLDQHRLKTKNMQEETVFSFQGRLAVIASAGPENWYHWLLQILPRLIILKESGVPFDRIYISGLETKWQKDSLQSVLRFLGIAPYKLLVINSNITIQAETLIVPSTPFIMVKKSALPTWLHKKLQEIFVKEPSLLKSEKYEKIYISRSKASVRRIANEKALIEMLKPLGFKILHLEDLPPEMQATIFNQAKYIVTPHGSALANLVFTKPGATTIEIDHGTKPPRSAFRALSKFTSGYYFPFYVDQTTEDHLEDDMKVDINAFKHFLQKIL